LDLGIVIAVGWNEKHELRDLSSRPTTKNPAKRETEEEWRDPEDVRAALLIQEVLPE